MTDLELLKAIMRVVANVDSDKASAAVAAVRAILGQAAPEPAAARVERGGRDRMERSGKDR